MVAIETRHKEIHGYSIPAFVPRLPLSALYKKRGKKSIAQISSRIVKGLNVIEGTIESATEDSVAISYLHKTRKIQVELDKQNILKARLAVKF